MKYIIQHTVLGFCWWDLLALVIVIAAILFNNRNLKKMKEQKEDLENRLSKMDAEKAENPENK